MLSTDCILFLRTCRAVFSWGLSHPCGGRSVRLHQQRQQSGKPGMEENFPIPWNHPNMLRNHQSLGFLCADVHCKEPQAATRKPPPPPPQYLISAWTKISWSLEQIPSLPTIPGAGSRTKGALMNELFTYLSARSAECEPDPPKCHFIMRPQSGALPLPSVTGDWKSLHVSPNSYQT